MVKWISRQSSELLLGVQIPLGAQSVGHFVQATGTTVPRRVRKRAPGAFARP